MAAVTVDGTVAEEKTCKSYPEVTVQISPATCEVNGYE